MTPKPTEDRIKQGLEALLAISNAVLETLAETPDGIAGGTLYAALMTTGMSLAQFERLMEILVTSGRVSKRGHFYYPAPTDAELPR